VDTLGRRQRKNICEGVEEFNYIKREMKRLHRDGRWTMTAGSEVAGR
jgi:hypothetical protein